MQSKITDPGGSELHYTFSLQNPAWQYYNKSDGTSQAHILCKHKWSTPDNHVLSHAFLLINQLANHLCFNRLLN